MPVHHIDLEALPRWLEQNVPGGPGSPAGGLTQEHQDRLWKLLRVVIIADVKERFARGVDPYDQPWKPLSLKRIRGDVDLPLRDTGVLMASITGSGKGAGNHVERTAPLQFDIGTNLIYAAIHQAGGTIRPRNAKALAIPWTLEALRAGSPKNFPRELELFWPEGKKTGWLVEKKERGKKAPKHAIRGTGSKFKSKLPGKNVEAVILQYMLVPQVTIPARPFLGAGPTLVQKISEVAADFFARPPKEARNG